MEQYILSSFFWAKRAELMLIFCLITLHSLEQSAQLKHSFVKWKGRILWVILFCADGIYGVLTDSSVLFLSSAWTRTVCTSSFCRGELLQLEVSCPLCYYRRTIVSRFTPAGDPRLPQSYVANPVFHTAFPNRIKCMLINKTK